MILHECSLFLFIISYCKLVKSKMYIYVLCNLEISSILKLSVQNFFRIFSIFSFLNQFSGIETVHLVTRLVLYKLMQKLCYKVILNCFIYLKSRFFKAIRVLKLYLAKFRIKFFQLLEHYFVEN
jgi:hypothetical protein